jgi:hypothetical protein
LQFRSSAGGQLGPPFLQPQFRPGVGPPDPAMGPQYSQIGPPNHPLQGAPPNYGQQQRPSVQPMGIPPPNGPPPGMGAFQVNHLPCRNVIVYCRLVGCPFSCIGGDPTFCYDIFLVCLVLFICPVPPIQFWRRLSSISTTTTSTSAISRDTIWFSALARSAERFWSSSLSDGSAKPYNEFYIGKEFCSGAHVEF